MKSIQDAQTIMASSLAITNKETKDMVAAGFKDIADKKEAERKKLAEDKEKAEQQAALDKKELMKEKRMQRWSLWLICAGIIINTIYGMLTKYAPHIIGLGK